MKSFVKFYLESLYPFQNGVMKLVNELETPFYLTGGTALSRHYFNHRYSDDLDLFVNQNDQYDKWIQRLFEHLEDRRHRLDFSIVHEKTIKGEHYTLLFLKKQDMFLKLEFVNDVAPHFGDFENNSMLGRIDSWQNILTNKLTALGRLEIKDFVDVWIIAKHYAFCWPSMFTKARQKDAGLDQLLVYELFKSIPPDALDLVKWSLQIDKSQFLKDMTVLADDFILGKDNSLII